MSKKEYSANQAAKILGVSYKTIMRYIKKGLIKVRVHPKLLHNFYYISHEEVMRVKEILENKNNIKKGGD